MTDEARILTEAVVVAKFHTSDFRGDHAADVCSLHSVREGETVAELCRRLFTKSPAYEWVELRLLCDPT